MSTMPPTQYQLPSASVLFLTASDSPLSRYLEENRRVVIFRPEILSAIERDIVQHGLNKKATRLEDQRWNRKQNQGVLPGHEDVANGDESKKNYPLVLGQGRPRISARACYFFWMVCTYAGGIKSRETRNLLKDSKCVELFLQEEGIKAPSTSTIMENVHAISQETRTMILDAQIAMAREEELDDFDKAQFDSTPVDANTAWPTNSALIWKLCRRLNERVGKLKRFGLSSVKIPVMDEIVKNLKTLDFKINCCPANQSERREELYREYLDDAESASHIFTAKLKELSPQVAVANLFPSKMKRLKNQVHAIRQNLENLYQAILHCIERVLDGESRPSKEKLLSIADPDAVFLKKGSRPARIGYVPQLARSEKGLVTALIVPKGNPGDAPLLQQLCEQSFKRTGVVPKESSADGGYASIVNRRWLLKVGVERPSFSSSKGKAITPIKDWESPEFLNLRKWRSAVEALMSQLKDQVNFGAAIKRGWERVQAELTDKVLAFNFMRLSCLRG